MKFFLLCIIGLFCFTCRPCCQRAKAVKPGRDPLANSLKMNHKERTLWQKKNLYLAANLDLSRNFGNAAVDGMVRRTSSYNVPLLLGRRLSRNWSIEGGPFLGINRNVYQRPTMLKEVRPMASTNAFSYGFVAGVSRRLADRLSVNIRYRRDLCESLHAWQPFQFGWSLAF